MIINELILDEFLGFNDKKIIMGSDNALIFGNNGSGKSALIDAISFALYGKSVRGISLTEKTSVTLNFVIGNDRYVIARTLEQGKQIVKFLENDKELDAEKIYTILGSFDDFLSKILIKQEYLNIINHNTIDALKETFHLYKYDKYNNEILKRIEEKNTILGELEVEANAIDSRVSALTSNSDDIKKEMKRLGKEKREMEKMLEKARRRLELLEKKRTSLRERDEIINDLKTRLALLNEELEKKRSLLKKLDNKEVYDTIKRDYDEFIRLKKRVVALEKKRIRHDTLTNMTSLLQSLIEEKSKLAAQLSNDLKNIKQRYKSSNLELKKLRDEMIKLDKNKIELESKRYRLDAEINLAKEQLNTILERVKNTRKSKRCPVCNQPLTNIKDLTTHMTDETNNIKKNMKAKERELADVMVKLRQVDTKIHQVEIMIAKAETTTKSMVEDLEKKALEVKDEINTLNTRLSKYKKELSLLKFDPKSYEKDMARYEELIKENIIERYITNTTKFNERKVINQDINRINNTITLLKKRLNSLLKAKSVDIYHDIINAREEIIRLNIKLDEINLLLNKKEKELEEALKKDDDIRTLKSKLNEINSSRKDISVQIEALKELRSMLRDTLLDVISKTIDAIKPYSDLLTDFEFKDDNLFVNGKEFANLSRGERAFYYMILRIAYMQALNTPLIIIDDNLSLIDRDRVRLLVSSINTPLIVLSHQDLREFFNNVIEL